MNLFLLQNVVGILRHAAEAVPDLRRPALLAADQLKLRADRPWLEASASLLEEAALLSGDPIYTTGVYWAACALAEMQDDGGAPLMSFPVSPPCLRPREAQDEIWEEAAMGVLELLDRQRRGATLGQALALFPSWGEESAPGDL